MTTDTAVRVTRMVVHEKSQTIFDYDIKYTKLILCSSPRGDFLRRLPGNSDQ